MYFANPFREIEETRKMHERRAARALEHKVDFDSIKTRPRVRGDIGLIASTFKPDNPLEAIYPGMDEKGVVSPSGNLRYLRKTFPAHMGMPISGTPDLYSYPWCAYFDGEVTIPVLQYKDRLGEWAAWMSLTPNELWSQRGGVQAATGRVVLGGLGMGWLLRQIVKKPTVKSVVVVEKDPELLDWFGTLVCEATPKVEEVICGDIYHLAPLFGTKSTKFILDIWPCESDAADDNALMRLRATGAQVWAWGSARPDRYQRERIRALQWELKKTKERAVHEQG